VRHLTVDDERRGRRRPGYCPVAAGATSGTANSVTTEASRGRRRRSCSIGLALRTDLVGIPLLRILTRYLR